MDIFLTSVKNILDDGSFKLNSPIAAEGRKVAECLLKWSLVVKNCKNSVKIIGEATCHVS